MKILLIALLLLAVIATILARLKPRGGPADADKKAGHKKDKPLASAGVRLLRWQVNAMPDEAAIRVAVGK